MFSDFRLFDCVDFQGHHISHGSKYVPDSNDLCTECTCQKKVPVRCHSVACSPPQNCKPLDNTCCEYVCNGTRPMEKEPDDGESITNLSLRLIASTVTSFLVLALLLFLVHRVRQRRLLLSMRRFEERAQQVHSGEDTDSEHYIPEVFMSVECPPYTDPPPPYSPPKPSQILPGEQPPPYDELTQNGDANRNPIASQERDTGQPEGEVYQLAELSLPAASNMPVSSVSHQGASLEAHCDVRPGIHPGRHRENVQLEHQVALQRPARAGDYCMEVRREIEPAGLGASSLPVYASADIVGHSPIVLSPEEVQVSYFPNMADSIELSRYGVGTSAISPGQPERMFARSVGNTRPSQRQNCDSHSRRRRREGSARGSSYAAQTLPATTAFQRFSNLFKRNSWRAKNRRRLQNPSLVRGVLETHGGNSPAQYSTLPGADYRSQRLYTGFDMSACNFYPTTASPSSSSSNSSSGGEHVVAGSNYPRQQSCPRSAQDPGHRNGPGLSQNRNINHNRGAYRRGVPGSYGNRDRSMPYNQRMPAYYYEQFQDDLRRHLPPMCRQSANFEPSQPRTVREVSPRPRTCYGDPRRENSDPSSSVSYPPRGHPIDGQEIILETIDLTGRLDLPRGQPLTESQHQVSSDHQQVLPHPSTTMQPIATNSQTSLASLICSNLPVASDVNSSNQTCDLLDPVDGRRNNSSGHCKVSAPLCSNVSSDIRRSLPNARRSPENLASRTSDDHALTADNCMDLQPHLPPFQHTSKPSSKSTIPTTQPTGMETSREHSLMRRSHSDTSEGSLFSVCSETGEQKLKATRLAGTDNSDSLEAAALPADSPYPQHPSLGLGQGSVSAGSSKKNDVNCDRESSCTSYDAAGTENKTVLKLAQNAVRETPPSCSGDEVLLGAHGGVSLSSDRPTQAEKSLDDQIPVFANCENEDLKRNNKPRSENDLMSCSNNRSDVNFNLNISPLTRKRLASKDLQPVVGLQEEDRMVKSVNLPPLNSLSYASSNKIKAKVAQETGEPSLFDLDCIAHPMDSTGQLSEATKKRRKKPNPVRRSSSPMSSYHGDVKQKSSVPLPDTRDSHFGLDSKAGKNSSKRKVLHQGVALPTHLHFNPNSGLSQMSQSTGDPAGNTDLIRARAQPAITLEVANGSATVPGAAANLGQASSTVDPGTLLGMNDLNQPPRMLGGSYEAGDGCKNSTYTPGFRSHHAVSNSKQLAGQQPRRKAGSGQQHHRRQASVGVLDKNAGRAGSPLRRKPRPKSLAAPSDYDSGKYLKHTTSASSTALRQDSESWLSRGGARSGFGCDMNLDDENGMADFHICPTTSSNQNKGMLRYAAIVGTAMPHKPPYKPDGPLQNVQEYGAFSVGGPNLNKSGPSRDLLFVGKSTPGKEKSSGVHGNRKRQSLAASNPAPSKDPSSCHGQVGSGSRNSKTGTHEQWPVQARVGSLARALSEEDVREATSYV
ncbi:integral membrane protein dgcr2/idd [Elysia marginata]|uniref:Integral membrane protein dgcr2/idd n=1 Tax=Elysia marginata TaxID=1093978 RepID=A0AAV4IHJ4_9GAST|nr:integral membrane protein dgcr2/idd [Elysia marginata]